MRNRIIRYAIDLDTGMIVSRVGDAFCWPILQYEKIGQDGDFTRPLEYEFERVEMDYFYQCPSAYRSLRFTRKVPVEVKNAHRAWWGMKSIPAQAGLRGR